MSKEKINKIKLLITVVKVFIPLTVLLLKFAYPQVKFGWFFVGYILFLTIERSIETFYSGRFEKNIDEVEKDTGFLAVTLAYIIMVFIMMFEFFIIPKRPIYFLSLIAGLVFCIAWILRIVSIKTLGERWQIAESERKLITDKGPYKYMRHPIYFGFILEVLAVPLVFFNYYAFLFSLLIFIPLIVIKTYLEEKQLIKIYGEKYKEYIKQRNAFPLISGPIYKEKDE